MRELTLYEMSNVAGAELKHEIVEEIVGAGVSIPVVLMSATLYALGATFAGGAAGHIAGTTLSYQLAQSAGIGILNTLLCATAGGIGTAAAGGVLGYKLGMTYLTNS